MLEIFSSKFSTEIYFILGLLCEFLFSMLQHLSKCFKNILHLFFSLSSAFWNSRFAFVCDFCLFVCLIAIACLLMSQIYFFYFAFDHCLILILFSLLEHLIIHKLVSDKLPSICYCISIFDLIHFLCILEHFLNFFLMH